MSSYTIITIIYNPNSTGPSKEQAQATARELQTALPGQKILLQATEFAGHAEDLAYATAKSHKYALIVSASGDGGYHEVVNGIMRAQNEGHSAVAGLVPTGNANDHHRNISAGNFIKHVVARKEQRIDLMKCSTKVNEQPYIRYAHSYIGFGLTPKAGRELNKTSLNFFNEKWAVVKTIFGLKPTRLIVHGKLHAYDSLVFSNIADMSKILSLSKIAKPNDGKFEVTAIRHRGFIFLLSELFRAVTAGMQSEQQLRSFDFKTKRKTLMQLDGEVVTVDANSTVAITSEQQTLRCVV